MNLLPCPLCQGSAQPFYKHVERIFMRCCNCLSVFLHPDFYLTEQQETAHYACHNNNPDDRGYQNFVRPIVNSILADFTKLDSGLDFGSGTGSPIVKLLRDEKYNIQQFDLYFYNEKQRLKQQYNYIACCETAEHFKNPAHELAMLRQMLLPEGKLYIMTERYNDDINFADWYYKNDPTHIFLYHKKAFEWIKDTFGFSKVEFKNRLAILSV
jgi:hypothetical protein